MIYIPWFLYAMLLIFDIICSKEMRDRMNRIKNIIDFSNAFGPSGLEDDVIALAKNELSSVVECEEDHMRNLYINCKGVSDKKVKILLDAHSDEVGFIVQAIKPNGMLRFLPLGGWDVKNIVTNKVFVRNSEGSLIPGVVCSKPVHFMNVSEKGKALDFADVLIDVGATSAKEVIESYGIGIGSFVVPAVDCQYDEKHEIFIGKAFDNRIGCAAVVDVMKNISHGNLSNYVMATLTSQEEVGERGMKCAMNNVNPDVVICFEGCPADDTFEEEYMIQSGLKRGPMLRHFDCSMITSPRFQRFALDVAKKYQIPVQESVRKGGGTNGGITHTAYQGIPTIVIGVPVRYAHSSYGILAYQDYQHAVELAGKIIEELNEEIVKNF